MPAPSACRPAPSPCLPDVETEEDHQTPARPTPLRDGPEGEEEAEPRRFRAAAPPPRPKPRPACPLRRRAPRGAARREREAFERAAEEIRAAVARDPALAELSRQLLIEQTPEGLRIQLLDAERQPMFALGGSTPNERARLLVARVAQVAARLPNPVTVTGHTDATPFRGGTERSNWDLSAERANATRRLLAEAGLPDSRIRSVAAMRSAGPCCPTSPPPRPTAASRSR
jgi:chemotaxis protein MotB